jgi:sulfur-oxidizing protein SoxZ
METGFRRDMNGKTIPMNVVDKLTASYGGKEVFSAELGSGMSANPYLQFYAVAQASGEIVVEWSDDRGERGRATAQVTVA